jgi:bacteriocin-like protein
LAKVLDDAELDQVTGGDTVITAVALALTAVGLQNNGAGIAAQINNATLSAGNSVNAGFGVAGDVSFSF